MEERRGLKAKIHLSVVSHGQGDIIGLLLNDLKVAADTNDLVVTLTLNIEELLPFDPESFPFPIRVIKNPKPKGFGANHNAAFAQFQGDAAYFCIANPDIRIHAQIFDALVKCLEQDKQIGVVAPLVRNSLGKMEDSVRPLPTPWAILAKVFKEAGQAVIRPAIDCATVDWVAGMFMLFPKDVFARMGGFDSRYFLYYEDVDLCCRLHLSGFKVVVSSSVAVEHDAQRTSHRKPKYFLWHLLSISRFFLSPVFFKRWQQIRRGRSLADNADGTKR